MFYIVPIAICAAGAVGWIVWQRRAPVAPDSSPLAAPAKPAPRANAGLAAESAENAVSPPNVSPAKPPADAGRRESLEPFPKSNQPAPGPSTSPRAKDSFDVDGGEGDPRWWNVLASTRDNRIDYDRGNPQFQNMALNCDPRGTVHARMTLAVVPPKEYILRVSVMRKDSAAEIDFGLTSGSSQFVLIVDGWGGGMHVGAAH
jgi:hypothetical protein